MFCRPDEFYDAVALRVSKELYEKIRAWALAAGGVTIIGGWAVYELVEPGYQRQSRDVDIVLHSQAALDSFNSQINGWGLRWRTHGRDTFKECCFIDGPDFPPIVDVFTTDPSIGQRRFQVNAGSNIKEAPGQGLIPTLGFLALDKLRTIPLRSGMEADEKRAKDFLDLHDLVFHNREGRLPADLARPEAKPARASALKFLDEARRMRTVFGRELTDVAKWLRL